MNGNQKHLINYSDSYWANSSICQHQLSKSEFLFVVGDRLCFKGYDQLRTVQLDKPILNIYVDSKDRVWLSFLNGGIKIYKILMPFLLERNQ